MFFLFVVSSLKKTTKHCNLLLFIFSFWKKTTTITIICAKRGENFEMFPMIYCYLFFSFFFFPFWKKTNNNTNDMLLFVFLFLNFLVKKQITVITVIHANRGENFEIFSIIYCYLSFSFFFFPFWKQQIIMIVLMICCYLFFCFRICLFRKIK